MEAPPQRSGFGTRQRILTTSVKLFPTMETRHLPERVPTGVTISFCDLVHLRGHVQMRPRRDLVGESPGVKLSLESADQWSIGVPPEVFWASARLMIPSIASDLASA